jgi:hypothetical protein
VALVGCAGTMKPSGFIRVAPCAWQIRKSRRDRHLEQTAAMMPPRVAVKDGVGGRRQARSFSRSAAAARLVNAILVVIILNSSSFRLCMANS